ncbi:MAG: hypothetical protein RLY86_69 [Pseudomonadota bacterium]|jgi:lipopolysaccharide export system permease protein
MTRVLSGYMGRLFLARTIAVLAALTALLQLLDLLDAASDVLERGGSVLDLGRYALLRLPVFAERLLPLAVLVGALSTLWTLAQSNEIVAMRSAGMTPYRIIAALVPVVAGIAAVHLVLADQVVPRAERAFLSWWAETEPPSGSAAAGEPETLWFRVGDTIVAASAVLDGGTRLTGIRSYERDGAGQVAVRLTAAEARWEGGTWFLIDGTRFSLDQPAPPLAWAPVDAAGGSPGDRRPAEQIAAVQAFDRLPWSVGLVPANVVDLLRPTESLSLQRLIGILRGTWAGGQSPAYYETRLHGSYIGPLASLVMLLLAAPVASGLRRRGGAQMAMGLGLGLGLLFMLASGLLAALGEAGVMPPVLAAWAPTLFFAALGGAILVHVEE